MFGELSPVALVGSAGGMIQQQTARIDQLNARVDGLSLQVLTIGNEVVAAMRQEQTFLADLARRVSRLEDADAA